MIFDKGVRERQRTVDDYDHRIQCNQVDQVRELKIPCRKEHTSFACSRVAVLDRSSYDSGIDSIQTRMGEDVQCEAHGKPVIGDAGDKALVHVPA